MTTIFFRRLLLAVLFMHGLLSAFGQAPAGYYSSAGSLTGTALQQALHDIIDDHTVKTYTYLWTAFGSTDVVNGTSTIIDRYSDVPNGTPPYTYTWSTDQCSTTPGFEGSCYNREHSFPKSWFGGEVSPMYTDLHHLIPSDSYVNTMRNNYPYGEVSVADWTSQNGSKRGTCTYPGYTGVAFEPIDAYKGDLARIYFYMAVRYYGEDGSWPGSAMVEGAQLRPWALNMLLEWHAADPVDAVEQARNNAVYAIQGNRNPFIDDPDYAAAIWQEGILPEPSNHASSLSASTITLNWTDATGETLPDGYLVNMSAVSFEDIAAPIDGTDELTNAVRQKVFYGAQTCTFGGLTPGQTYFFRLYPYTGTGNNIDYKTDGNPLQISLQAN